MADTYDANFMTRDFLSGIHFIKGFSLDKHSIVTFAAGLSRCLHRFKLTGCGSVHKINDTPSNGVDIPIKVVAYAQQKPAKVHYNRYADCRPQRCGLPSFLF
jgi:hypothetical protein